MILIPNFQRGIDYILDFCNSNPDLFVRRVGSDGHAGALPFTSRFSSLKSNNMPSNLIDHIFDNGDWDKDLRDLYFFIQIQRYYPGDYIVPHKDNYNITKLHLVTLTSSDCDGIILQTGDDMLEKVFDKAGQKIESDLNDYHWVDPCRDLRYSLVITE